LDINSLDNKCITIAIEAARNLTGFFLDKRWEQEVVETFRRNETSIARLIGVICDYQCNFMSYSKRVALTNLMILMPGLLHTVYERFAPQISELNLSEFETQFQDIVTVITDMEALKRDFGNFLDL
jgi:hypothetical protein